MSVAPDWKMPSKPSAVLQIRILNTIPEAEIMGVKSPQKKGRMAMIVSKIAMRNVRPGRDNDSLIHQPILLERSVAGLLSHS